MKPIEIIVIIVAVLIVVSVFGIRIYKRIHNMPVDEECIECHTKMKKALKRMRKANAKKIKKENNNVIE